MNELIEGEMYSLDGDDSWYLYMDEGLIELTKQEAMLMIEKLDAEWDGERIH